MIRRVTIHLLEGGLPLCRFTLEVPGRWPYGHIWMRPDELAPTKASIADPESPIHHPWPMDVCAGCECVHYGYCPECGADLPCEHPDGQA